MRKFNGLRPQDIVLLLKLAAHGTRHHWQGKELANSLDLSTSEISDSLARCRYSRLLTVDPQRLAVHRQALRELLVHGLPYIFAVHPGSLARGLVTGASAPPLSDTFGSEPAYVWPDATGETWGISIEPLYAGVPAAARRDERLHELLALVDALRLGRPRERAIASKLLNEYLPTAASHHAE
ncbi:hypothetical protein [Hymenobacter cavernae]|uniref:MarR family transcriptional regulator n=1 Tax=Hymenobacter cavernae TaxID=2044852 RepID=A0ABQ1UVI2_9BACT|nr:hypothetical protein [Hymenobacter cavernae]GGF27910.1 hypothetical protein GCM10011383_44510 [Hymenobacter cavernae]